MYTLGILYNAWILDNRHQNRYSVFRFVVRGQTSKRNVNLALN